MQTSPERLKSLEDASAVMSVPEMCAVLGIARATGYNLIHSSAGPKTIKIGRRILVPKSALIEWIEKPTQAHNQTQYFKKGEL